MKALASDFDGTIYFAGEEEKFKQQDLEAVRQFQKEGSLFGICTGRPLVGIKTSTQGQIDFDFYILSSGTIILDKNEDVIFCKGIPLETIKAMRKMTKTECHMAMHVGKELYILDSAWELNFPQIRIDSPEEIPADNAQSVSFKCRDVEQAIKMVSLLQESFPEIEVFRNYNYIDTAPKGCSKGAAIQWYKEHENLSVIAGIGDADNDQPLLEKADVSFAMEKAPQYIHDLCDHSVHSVAEAIQILSRPE